MFMLALKWRPSPSRHLRICPVPLAPFLPTVTWSSGSVWLMLGPSPGRALVITKLWRVGSVFGLIWILVFE